MITIPCSIDGCDQPAKYFELPSKWGTTTHVCHCQLHARGTKEDRYAWNVDIQKGGSTKSKRVYLAELTEILKSQL